MDRINSRYLFLLLIITIGFVHAVPKIKGSIVHNKLQSQKKSLRQGLAESIEINHLPPEREGDGSAIESQDSASLDDDAKQKSDNIETEDDNVTDVTDEHEDELDADNNRDPEASEADQNHDDKDTRSLAVGDTFTTTEMWEISKRLIGKVKHAGKGIVSSAKNAYELADRLFEAYFLTLKRIVIIRDVDIAGLDALQALSLTGDVVDSLRTSLNSFTETPIEFPKGQFFDEQPRKCHYKVLRKLVDKKAEDKSKNIKRRQAAKLKQKLGKNRKLVINPGRRELEKKNKSNRNDDKHHAKITGTKKRELNPDKNKPGRMLSNKKPQLESVNKKTLTRTNKKTLELICRWKYQCSNPVNLNSCRLHRICKQETDGQSISFLDEDEKLREFRRMIGVDVIDEEVEKIVEAHILLLRENQEHDTNKIESLAEYFNKIVESEAQLTTPAMKADSDEDATENPDVQMDNEPEALSSEHALSEAGQVEDDDAEARRILGLPAILNTKANGPPSNKH